MRTTKFENFNRWATAYTVNFSLQGILEQDQFILYHYSLQVEDRTRKLQGKSTAQFNYEKPTTLISLS